MHVTPVPIVSFKMKGAPTAWFPLFLNVFLIAMITVSAATFQSPRSLKPLLHHNVEEMHSWALSEESQKLKEGKIINITEGFSDNFLTRFLSRKMNEYADDVFEKTDIDSDGCLSFDEVYKLTLLIYIRVNRKAPIPPPTEKEMRILFDRADFNRSGTLTKREFKRLLRIGLPRTTIRLMAHRIISILVAPMLAYHIVHYISGKNWAKSLAANVVESKRLPGQYADRVLSEKFWTVGMTVLFVSKLAHGADAIMTYFYDAALKFISREDA